MEQGEPEEECLGDGLERNLAATSLRGVVVVVVVVGAVVGVGVDQSSVVCHFWNTYTDASP